MTFVYPFWLIDNPVDQSRGAALVHCRRVWSAIPVDFRSDGIGSQLLSEWCSNIQSHSFPSILRTQSKAFAIHEAPCARCLTLRFRASAAAIHRARRCRVIVCSTRYWTSSTSIADFLGPCHHQDPLSGLCPLNKPSRCRA